MSLFSHFGPHYFSYYSFAQIVILIFVGISTRPTFQWGWRRETTKTIFYQNMEYLHWCPTHPEVYRSSILMWNLAEFDLCCEWISNQIPRPQISLQPQTFNFYLVELKVSSEKVESSQKLIGVLLRVQLVRVKELIVNLLVSKEENWSFSEVF